MGLDSAIYQIVLLLHTVAAIVGFGGVITHGFYNAKAFRGTAGEAAPILRATQGVTNLAHYGFYGLFVFGLLLIPLSDGAFSFAEPWISAAFVVIFAVIGMAHGLVRPAVRGLTARAEAMAPGDSMETDAEVNGLAKKLALGEGLTQLLLVVALVLMIWQFGH